MLCFDAKIFTQCCYIANNLIFITLALLNNSRAFATNSPYVFKIEVGYIGRASTATGEAIPLQMKKDKS